MRILCIIFLIHMCKPWTSPFGHTITPQPLFFHVPLLAQPKIIKHSVLTNTKLKAYQTNHKEQNWHEKKSCGENFLILTTSHQIVKSPSSIPPCFAQWKLSKDFMWLDGHPFTDINDANYVKNIVSQGDIGEQAGIKTNKNWTGILPYLCYIHALWYGE